MFNAFRPCHIFLGTVSTSGSRPRELWWMPGLRRSDAQERLLEVRRCSRRRAEDYRGTNVFLILMEYPWACFDNTPSLCLSLHLRISRHWDASRNAHEAHPYFPMWPKIFAPIPDCSVPGKIPGAKATKKSATKFRDASGIEPILSVVKRAPTAAVLPEARTTLPGRPG